MELLVKNFIEDTGIGLSQAFLVVDTHHVDHKIVKVKCKKFPWMGSDRTVVGYRQADALR